MMREDKTVAEACSANSLGGPVREKYWDEISIEQKLDRLRDAIIQGNRKMIETHNVMGLLSDHVHGAYGEINVPLHRKIDYVEDRMTRIPYQLRTSKES